MIVFNLSDAPDENKTILRLLEFNRIKRICNPYWSPKILSKIGVLTQGQCSFAQVQDQGDSDCRFQYDNCCDNINKMHADNMDTLNDCVYMDCAHSNRIPTYDMNIKQTTNRSLRLLFTVVQEEK